MSVQHVNEGNNPILPSGGRASVAVAQNTPKPDPQYVDHLQKSLSTLQMDRERLENDYRRLGNMSKNMQ